MKLIVRSGLCLLFLWTLSLAGHAAVIHLDTGGAVEGKILEETATEVTVQTGSGFTMTIPKAGILRIEESESAYEAYEKRLQEAEEAGTASAFFELSEWAEERDMQTEEIELLRQVLELDPDHEKAKSRLQALGPPPTQTPTPQPTATPTQEAAEGTPTAAEATPTETEEVVIPTPTPGDEEGEGYYDQDYNYDN